MVRLIIIKAQIAYPPPVIDFLGCSVQLLLDNLDSGVRFSFSESLTNAKNDTEAGS